MRLHGSRRRRGAIPFVEVDEDARPGLDADEGESGNERWAAHAWRARLCRGYGDPSTGSAAGAGAASTSAPGVTSSASNGPFATRRSDERRLEEERTKEEQDKLVGRGGAAPGRIGRVYEVGSFAGLWAGTILVSASLVLRLPFPRIPMTSSHSSYLSVLPHRIPVFTIRSHTLRYATCTPPPPCIRYGGTMRATPSFSSLSSTQSHATHALPALPFFHYALRAALHRPPLRSRRRLPAWRPRARRLGCPGCVKAEDRARWARAGGVDGDGDVEMEASPSSDERSSSSQERSSTPSSPSQDRTPSKPSSSSTDDRTSSSKQDHRTPSSGPYSSSLDSWPEWEAPAWAGHRFAEDEG
ncbi:hypothetical protein B0H17DRAFT_329885 [Mycena rosella]|uniref:Uncharacterized protein n=1 Tax=Mycena rosella TaxID=1033263 RepID=A0AAD7CSR2_MYCRO|nr:hypothetical protein B0H17DRAFT_329885 [Mycena rosella]